MDKAVLTFKDGKTDSHPVHYKQLLRLRTGLRAGELAALYIPGAIEPNNGPGFIGPMDIPFELQSRSVLVGSLPTPIP